MKDRLGFVPLLLVAGLCLPLGWGCSHDDTRSVPSEGTRAEPVDLGEAPVTYSGTVATGGDSYYMTTTAAATWQVTISNIDGDPQLFVYDDDAFADDAFAAEACPEPKTGALPEACEVECVEEPCDYYIRVQGGESKGSSYNLTVAPIVAP